MAGKPSFNVQTFINELDQELSHASDRGLSLVALSGLERLLEILLSTAVAESRDPEVLFASNGPLQTVDSKILMAHTLGLISDDEKRELNLLRKVRNQMAHNLYMSFNNSAIADRCRNLVLCNRLYTPESMPALKTSRGTYMIPPDEGAIASADLPLIDLELPNPSDPRTRVYASAIALTKVLGTRIQLRRNGAEGPAEFTSPLELQEARIHALELEIAASPEKGASNSFETVVLKGFRYSRALIEHAMAERDGDLGH